MSEEGSSIRADPAYEALGRLLDSLAAEELARRHRLLDSLAAEELARRHRLLIVAVCLFAFVVILRAWLQ